MVSEDFFTLRRYLENRFNTTSKIDLTFDEAHNLVEKLYAMEEQIIALESAAIPEAIISEPQIKQGGNVISLKQWKKGA